MILVKKGMIFSSKIREKGVFFKFVYERGIRFGQEWGSGVGVGGGWWWMGYHHILDRVKWSQWPVKLVDWRPAPTPARLRWAPVLLTRSEGWRPVYQNGCPTFPHWFTKFCLEWGYQSWLDDHTYFANQVWSHLAIWVSNSCIPTGNIHLGPEFIHTLSATSRSHRVDPPPRYYLPLCHCVVRA